MIRIEDELYIAAPWPAVFLGEYNALVFADLHLGIEGVLAEEGIYLPKRISKITLDLVINTIEDVKAQQIIFLGDVKHSFSLLKVSEWIELKNLFRYLDEKKYKVEVVRGNHDNYLGVLLSKFSIPFHKEYISLPPYTLIHGHLTHKIETLNKVTLMGHEHPSVTLRDQSGVSHKFKAFLYGEIKEEKKLLVLPAVCELAGGSTINAMSKEEFLSPILKMVYLDNFTPYLIVPGKYVQKFPILRELRII